MNKKFLIGLAVLTVVLFALQYRMPRRFSWEPSFAGASHQPFGCYVFDTVLATSMPHGYQAVRLTPWQLHRDSAGCRSLIVLGNYGTGYQSELLKMAREGWRILLLTDGKSDMLDSLHLDCEALPAFSYEQVTSRKRVYGRILWTDDDGYTPRKEGYTLVPQLVSATLKLHQVSEGRALALFSSGSEGMPQPVVVQCPVGKGEIIVCSAPLLFTNYGMLNDECRPVVTRVLNRLKELPVVRIDDSKARKGETARNEQTPFIVFLERPPLRLALYLSVLTLVLFLVFTARRRQRAIPVVEPPKNQNMEFVKLIGTIYYRRRDREGRLQQKLTEMHRLYEQSATVSEQELDELMDEMNEIIKKE